MDRFSKFTKSRGKKRMSGIRKVHQEEAAMLDFTVTVTNLRLLQVVRGRGNPMIVLALTPRT